jgi:hypothetical protein
LVDLALEPEFVEMDSKFDGKDAERVLATLSDGWKEWKEDSTSERILKKWAEKTVRGNQDEGVGVVDGGQRTRFEGRLTGVVFLHFVLLTKFEVKRRGRGHLSSTRRMSPNVSEAEFDHLEEHMTDLFKRSNEIAERARVCNGLDGICANARQWSELEGDTLQEETPIEEDAIDRVCSRSQFIDTMLTSRRVHARWSQPISPAPSDIKNKPTQVLLHSFPSYHNLQQASNNLTHRLPGLVPRWWSRCDGVTQRHADKRAHDVG